MSFILAKLVTQFRTCCFFFFFSAFFNDYSCIVIGLKSTPHLQNIFARHNEAVHVRARKTLGYAFAFYTTSLHLLKKFITQCLQHLV